MSKENEVLLNEDIRASEVRCVGDDGTTYGVISRDEALKIADKMGLSVKIAQNDINFKVKHALEFLSEGKHVKFRVFLKGREMNTPEAGVVMLEKVWEMIKDKAERDKEPNIEGRYVNMLVTPKRS